MVMAIADANAFETVLKRDLARSCPLTVGLNVMGFCRNRVLPVWIQWSGCRSNRQDRLGRKMNVRQSR